MLLASILAPIAEGLLSTLTVDAPFSHWFGYEAFVGLAVGMGMQQPVMAVQTVLTLDDVPIASSLVVFMQTLGAAIFVAVAQAVFGNRLISNLQTQVPGLPAASSEMLRSGATDILSKVPPSLQRPILEAFNDAITRVYIVSIVASSLTLFGSLAMEWRSVKKGKNAETATTDA